MPPEPPAVNLERKTRVADLGATRARLSAIPEARFIGELRQRDTYFVCARGRLKLRETPSDAELIAYERDDAPGVRASHYRRVPVADGEALRAALGETLGVRVVVDKVRELWLFHNVRVHLDAVAGLGAFVEFEAVLADGADEAISLVRLETLGAALGLAPADDVAGGYADLLEAPIRST